MTKTSLIGVIAFGMVIGSCGGAGVSKNTAAPLTPASQPEASSQSKLSNITLKDVDGQYISLSEYTAGKVALFSFFATYCEPCKQKTVDHQALYDKFKDKGFAIIAISVDEPETIGQVRPFVKSRNLTFPVLYDPDFKAINQLNPRRAQPFSILLDRTGKSVWTHEGYVPGDDKLIESEVVKVLAAPTE